MRSKLEARPSTSLGEDLSEGVDGSLDTLAIDVKVGHDAQV